MLKKILALMLAVLILSAFAVGCKKKPVEGSSSGKKPSSSTVSTDDDNQESSDITDGESSISVGDVGDEDDGYWPYPWTVETTSAYFRDSEEAKQSVTVGESVKQYTDPGKLELGCYHSIMIQLQIFVG